MGPFNTIGVHKGDDIATITLDRPQRLNAWTHEMGHELHAAISELNEDPEVGAMVVTGAGRGFCAGADIRDTFLARVAPSRSPAAGAKARMDASGGSGGSGGEQRGTGDWIGLVRSSKPLIAAVNGACVGVGATMILPMDIIVASEDAKFGMAFVKMGVTPELASSHFLVQRIGLGRAGEMCLTGRLYSGKEAFDLGLADRLTTPGDLLEAACALAREIAANPTPQLRWVKDLLTRNGAETDISLVQRREAETLAKAYASAEHREAVDAFLNKRAPVFERRS